MAQMRVPHRFAPPNPYYYSQQQPWNGQVGTRSIGGQQAQPLSPADFGAPNQLGGFRGPPGGGQGQLGQQPGVGMPEQEQVNLSPQEKTALHAALEILKEGRAALASGVAEGPVIQRLTAAHAYVSGFLEAKGIEELGEYLGTIPQVTTRGTPMEDPEYDQVLDEFESFLTDESQTQTRGGWGKLGKVAWKIAKKHGPRVAGEVAEYGERRGWW